MGTRFVPPLNIGVVNMDEPIEKRLLMPYELARVLNVPLSWVRTHSAPSSKIRIPVKKVGGLLRYDLQEVMNWLARKDAI